MSYALSRIMHLLLAASLFASTDGRAAATVGESQYMVISNPTANDPKTAFRQPDAIPFPSDDLYTPEKARLGRSLFFDPRLSVASSLSCSSCHSPDLAYGDGKARSVGAGATLSTHRAPAVINLAWSDLLMWDGRFETLERQSIGVLEAAGVMNTPVASAVARLAGIAGYRAMFEAAFPGQPIDGVSIARAIATYERTIVSARSPFDAWVDGNAAAVSGAAQAGFGIFTGKANCVACHGGPNFSDNGFHDIGLPGNDPGRGNLFPEVIAMQHAFKTPSLREIEHRAPYMHDGSLATLAAVVEHYNSGGLGRPSQAASVRPLHLTEAEQADLVAFLQSLSSARRPASAPNLPH